MIEKQEWFRVIIRPRQSANRKCKTGYFSCRCLLRSFVCSRRMELVQMTVWLPPNRLTVWLPPYTYLCPYQKSERPGCSLGLISKDVCTHRSNNWIMLSNVIHTQKYMRRLSPLYFLPPAMTAASLSSTTALCLKLITPFKSCVAEDDCQEFARWRHL